MKKLLFRHIIFVVPLCMIFFVSASHGISQSGPSKLNADFSFQNGVLLDFKDFQTNEPGLSWNDLRAEAHMDAAGRVVRFSGVKMLEDENPVDVSAFWGVVIEGIPFVNVNRIKGKELLRSKGKEPVTFVKLQALGKLCYFYYEAYVPEEVPMDVYDPSSGRKIISASIENQKASAFKKILVFETGEFVDYNFENFLNLIKDDKSLLKTLKDLPESEARSKMYKCLFIYNDRNPVYVSD